MLTLQQLFIVLSLSLLPSVSSHKIYYVQPDDQSTPCPANNVYYDDCLKLSQYANKTWKYFQSNTTFYFLEGQHTLDQEIIIIAADHLILAGLGEWREGPTLNSMTSTAVIRCTEKIGGIRALVSKAITVNGITITNCTSKHGPALYFESVKTLLISKTSFHNNSKSGMGTFNVANMIIDSCSFSMNGCYTQDITGNLEVLTYLITFNAIIKNTNFTFSNFPVDISLESSTNVELLFQNVLFDNNKERGSMWLSVYNSSINSIVLDKVVVINGYANENRGLGGIILYLDNTSCSYYSQIIVKDVFFEHNFIAAMAISFHKTCYCNITIVNCTFLSNGITEALSKKLNDSMLRNTFGSGLTIRATPSSHSNTITLVNCTFRKNSAQMGGALLYWKSCRNNIVIINSTFEENFAYYGPAISFRFDSATKECKLILVNVTVAKNGVFSKKFKTFLYGHTFDPKENIFFMNSAFTIYASHRMFVEMTNVTIRDNYNMSGLSIHGCDVKFNGVYNAFINNSSPLTGAGLTMSTSNSFIVNKGSHVLFANNTAGLYGGAIYITEVDQDDLYISVTVYGEFKKCSFMTNQFPPNSSKPLISFQNNHAGKAGDNVYGGVFQFCKLSRHHRMVHSPLECPIAEYWSLSNKNSISSSPLAVCPCFNNIVNCTVRELNRKIYPGQSFSVSLVIVGACQGVSPANLVASMTNGSIMTTAKNQVTSRQCKQFEYLVNPTSMSNVLNMSQVFINAARTMINIGKRVSVNISFLQCPDGFELSIISDQYQCDCDSIILNSNIPAECNIRDILYGAFNRSGNNWIGYLPQYNCTIAHTNCPFDYCKPDHISFNITSPDPQCRYNRSGILCGQCSPGLSLMLGSNHCGNCANNTYALLVIGFAIAGIVLLFALILFNVTVSSGDINGLLFYANLVKLNESIFFPSGPIPVLSYFISWLNLDLGIKTCFINGLDGYWKTWLQFVFPFYLWFLVITVVIGCQYSLRLSRLCGQNAVPVLATLFLMSYTKLLRNITNVFMYTTVMCGNFHWILWRVEIGVQYLGAKHMTLIVFSMVLVILSVVYTFLVLFSQWLQRYSNKCFRYCSIGDPVVKFKPFIDAYCGPYKDKCRYWTGLLLLGRILFTIIFSYTSNMSPQINKTILVLVILFLILMAWFVNGMYKDKLFNYLEAFHYLNLCLITLGSTFLKQEIVTTLSVSSVLLLAVLMRMFRLVKYLKRKHHEWHKINDSEIIPILAADIDNNKYHHSQDKDESPAAVVRRRESLIFDFELSH